VRVAVAPQGYRERGGTELSAIVAGYDASPESELALESAWELARATGAPLKIVSVAQPPPIIYGKSGGASGGWNALKETIAEETRARLERAQASVPDDIPADAEMITGDPAEALADAANAPG
jgi:nucleotide-binding universal stress UspA family protein